MLLCARKPHQLNETTDFNTRNVTYLLLLSIPSDEITLNCNGIFFKNNLITTRTKKQRQPQTNKQMSLIKSELQIFGNSIQSQEIKWKS